MELAALVIVIIVSLIFYDRYRSLLRRVKKLEELQNSPKKKKVIEKKGFSSIEKELLEKNREIERKIRTASASAESPALSVKKEIIVSASEKKAESKKKKESRSYQKKSSSQKTGSLFWKRIEKRFVENWTGLIGAIVMVIGVSFLGLYAAFKLTPFFRFFLIILFALFLYGIANYLKNKAGWENLSSWFQSSSGAIFLFACLGSIAIPGLKWIQTEKLAYLILIIGIIINLLLSFTAKQEFFASMHVVFSLASLVVIPQSKTILFIAAIVSLFGVIMTYRSKWEYHLLVTISSFFLFHTYWFYRQGYFIGADINFSGKIAGIIVTAVIGISTYFFHYQELYKTQKFNKLAFFIHLVNWIYMGLGFLFYSSGSKYNTIILGFAAIACFFMANYAKKQKILWLYHTDILIAQFITILAITTLGRWNINQAYLSFFAYLEILIFLVIMILEKETLLIKIGSFLYFSAALVCFVLNVESGEKISLCLMALLSGITFYISKKYRSEEKALYFGQIFVAQLFAIFSILLLYNYNFKPVSILFFIYLEIFIFLFINTGEKLLKKIGIIQHYLSIFIFLGFSLYNYFYIYNKISFLNTVLIGVLFIIEFAYHIYATRYNKDHIDNLEYFIPEFKSQYRITISDFVFNIILFVLYVHLYHYLWSVYVIVPIIILLLIYRNYSQSVSLFWGLIFIIIASNILALNHIRYDISGIIKMILYSVPFFILAIFSIKESYLAGKEKYIKWPGIYLFAVNLIFYGYYITVNFSPFVPGILYILLSVIYLEVTNFLAKGDTRRKSGQSFLYTLQIGYIFIFLFFIRHFLVHMQSGLYLGIFSVRLLIEILGIMALLYWAIVKLPERKEKNFFWQIKPFCWEILLLFIFYTIALEVSTVWHPITWVVFALVIFLFKDSNFDDLSRFQYYSVLLFWISSFYISFVSTTYVTPSDKLTDQAWLGGFISLFFQFFYIAYFYRNADLKGINFPYQGKKSRHLLQKINESQNIWIYLPFFLATALFFYWSFSKALLTIFWVLEVFAIFILSLFLKEKWFRYISVGGLTVCLIRLFFYDLYKTSTITKAFVFLGVGLIMLLMNMLYTKYKDRF